MIKFILPIVACFTCSEGEWINAKDEFPPASGKILIYAENGNFVKWKRV